MTHSNGMESGSARIPEVWIVSNLPPPAHGVSVFNQHLVDELERRAIRFRFFPIGARSPSHIGRWQAGKLLADVTALIRLVQAARRRSRAPRPILYYTPSQGGLASVRDRILVLAMAPHVSAIVAHLHGCAWLHVVRSRKLLGRIMRSALERSDAVVCLGPTYARIMNVATELNCVSVNNGAPPPRTPGPKTPPIRNCRLLYLGALLESKGVSSAALACRELCRRDRAATLVMAGEWQHRREAGRFLSTFAAEIRQGRIQLVGAVDEARKESLFHESDFLLLPSRVPEGQPLVLIEAMSHGVLPITTPRGGIPDLLGFPRSEWLADPGHEDAGRIADKIELFLDRPGDYATLSASCQRYFDQHLRFTTTVDRLLEVFAAASASGVTPHRQLEATLA